MLLCDRRNHRFEVWLSQMDLNHRELCEPTIEPRIQDLMGVSTRSSSFSNGSGYKRLDFLDQDRVVILEAGLRKRRAQKSMALRLEQNAKRVPNCRRKGDTQ